MQLDTPRYANDIIKEFDLSRSMRTALLQAHPAFDKKKTQIGIAQLLDELLFSNLDANSAAAEFARNVFPEDAEKAIKSSASKRDKPPSESLIEPALWEALKEASDIRRSTGGNDRYVGTRIVVFSIFTSDDNAVGTAALDFLRRKGGNVDRAKEEAARLCWVYREPPEDSEVWGDIFARRGIVHPGATGFAPLQPDDPWAQGLVDRAGAGPEAEAFAAMITSPDFKPPLAVGIFGDWGSGKSFFLRLIHDDVEAIARHAGKDGDGDNGNRFQRHIAQVKFNAWHYADANLWPSLVDHIFTEIDRSSHQHMDDSQSNDPFARLATARRLTVAAAEELIAKRKRRNAAAVRLRQAEAELAMREQSVGGSGSVIAGAWWDTLTNDQGRAWINQSADELGSREGPGSTNRRTS